LQIPSGEHDVLNAQSAHKEIQWSKLSPEKKALWRDAAATDWAAYVDNKAIQV